MKKLTFFLCALSLLLLVRWRSPAQEAPVYQVIVHPGNPVTSLSKSDVSKYLLRKIPRWDHGELVQPVDLNAKSALRKVFSKDVHGRSAGSVKSYWQRQIFSGGKVPPPELNSEDEVVTFIKDKPGAIGYVSTDSPVDGVKVVTVTE